MKSLSMMNKLVVAGLLACTTGTGLWAAYGAEARTSGGQALPQELDRAGKALALQSWRDYMRQIGWNEDRVQVAHPAFVDAITSRELLPDGTWRLVFDGTRPGEIRKVTLRVDTDGQRVGEAKVEWADMCVAAELLPGAADACHEEVSQ